MASLLGSSEGRKEKGAEGLARCEEFPTALPSSGSLEADGPQRGWPTWQAG